MTPNHPLFPNLSLPLTSIQYSTDNKIGPDGGQSIADALKINQSITNMNLYSMTPESPFIPPNSSLPLSH
jgi:hypothetical protein